MDARHGMVKGVACRAVILLFSAAFSAGEARAQFGLASGGVGPINRSMGGAATAAPLDAAGALFWNPATITGLNRSEMVFGADLLIPRTTITSRIAPHTLGPGQSAPLSGTTGGNNGVFPIPTFGLVYQPEESPLTYGVGFFNLGAFGVNYPASRTNPVLMPQAPFGAGVGPLFSQYSVFQVAPTIAWRATPQLSVGFSADLDMASLQVNPALFSTPALVSTPLGAAPAYAAGTDGRYRFGGGFHVGVYYDTLGDWHFGAAIKSPQWFESYTYNGVSAVGQPVTPKVNLNFPMIASVGTSYTGYERVLIAADLRFVDYRNTSGFSQTGYDKEGALRGLGWQNVFALATGMQYQATDTISVRMGYTFSLNPAGNAVTSYNLASPTIIQNTLSLGASYDVTQSLKLSLAYVHYFQNSITGPIITPGVGALPGSFVRTTATADSVILGASVTF